MSLLGWTIPPLITDKSSQICSMSSIDDIALHCIAYFSIESNVNAHELQMKWKHRYVSFVRFEIVMIAEIMVFPCCNESCKKQFSSKFNRNKHEKIKGHSQENAKPIRKIPFDRSTKLFSCPTIDCTTTSKYKDNIVKLLKSCYIVNRNKKAASDNKICHICNKEFINKGRSSVLNYSTQSSDYIPLKENIQKYARKVSKIWLVLITVIHV